MLMSSSQGGFNVLAIFLSFLFILILFGSGYSLFQKRAIIERKVDCDERKWRWSQVADDFESKLKSWEIVAPSCLHVGFEPVSLQEQVIKVSSAKSSQHLLDGMKVRTQLIVPKDHQFSTGDQILVCASDQFEFATVSRVEIGTIRSLLTVEFEPTQQEILYPKGAIVVSTDTGRFIALVSQDPKEKMLFQLVSEQQRRPIETGFFNFDLYLKKGVTGGKYDGKISFSKDTCELNREFVLKT